MIQLIELGIFVLLVLVVIAISIAVIIGFLFFTMIKWLISLIKAHKLKSKSKTRLYDFLIENYGFCNEVELADEKNINKKLKILICNIISNQNIHPTIDPAYKEMRSNFKQAIEFSTVWVNVPPLKDHICDGVSLLRQKLKYKDEGFLDISGSQYTPFMLKSNKCNLYFYPIFVIAEINYEYRLIYYSDIAIGNCDYMFVTEQNGEATIKGASPVYYNYLHQRVDGGPDRRYKDNPATPVYRHTTLIISIGVDIQIIAASEESTALLSKGFLAFQEVVANHPIQNRISVKKEVLLLKENDDVSCCVEADCLKVTSCKEESEDVTSSNIEHPLQNPLSHPPLTSCHPLDSRN